jgi:predicted nuclease with RNAse H fold
VEASTAAVETAATTSAMPATAMLSECRCRNASDCQRGAQRKDQFQEIGVLHFDPPTNFDARARHVIHRHTTFDCNSARQVAVN